MFFFSVWPFLQFLFPTCTFVFVFLVYSSSSFIFFLKKMCSGSLTNKAENKTNRNVERGTCSDVRTKKFTRNFFKLEDNDIKNLQSLFTNVCNKLECFSSVWDLFNSSCFQHAPMFLLFLSIHLFHHYFSAKNCAWAVWHTKPKQNKQIFWKRFLLWCRDKINSTGIFLTWANVIKIVCNKLRCLYLASLPSLV